jgi:predicted transporter
VASSSAIALLIGLALLLANLPFLTQGWMGVVKLSAPKHVGWHLLELLLYYGLCGLVAWGIEKQIGQVAPQKWEFYAISATMFLTLAFPGFVYRYLWKRHG